MVEEKAEVGVVAEISQHKLIEIIYYFSKLLESKSFSWL